MIMKFKIKLISNSNFFTYRTSVIGISSKFPSIACLSGKQMIESANLTGNTTSPRVLYIIVMFAHYSQYGTSLHVTLYARDEILAISNT